MQKGGRPFTAREDAACAWRHAAPGDVRPRATVGACERIGRMDPVYLDHNGTTPVAPEVADAMWPFLTEHCGNPSSASPAGRFARAAIETAREHVAELIGATADEITFTSGGTEANNLAIRGVTSALRRSRSAATSPGRRRPGAADDSTRTDEAPGIVVTSSVEHPATLEPVELLREQGWDVGCLPVDRAGHTRLDPFPAAPIALGSMILAQNETGALQPVREFADLVHRAGGVVHVDAAQAVGKIEVDVDDLAADLLSVAGHKLYAPKAVGALYVRRGTPIEPLVVGAGQERGLRPGTENVAGIVGLGRAAELARRHQGDDARRMAALRDDLWARLHTAEPRLVRISPESACLPNTLMVSLPAHLGREVLEVASGVEASTGSACHAGVDSPARTLVAMGIDDDVALGAIRLTLGRSTTATDVERAALCLIDAMRGR